MVHDLQEQDLASLLETYPVLFSDTMQLVHWKKLPEEIQTPCPPYPLVSVEAPGPAEDPPTDEPRSDGRSILTNVARLLAVLFLVIVLGSALVVYLALNAQGP